MICVLVGAAERMSMACRIATIATVLSICGTLACDTPRAAAQAAPARGEAAAQPRQRVVLRFLTDSDFPPFNYLDEEGALAGFHVDLARAICLETSSSCDVKARPWDELLPALVRGEADAVIAGHVVSARALASVDFTDRYIHTPGRFVGLRSSPAIDATPSGLDGKRIGVAKDTAHEAYIRTFFRDSRIETFASPELARDALMAAKVDAIFEDGIGVGNWLGGSASRDCCEFKGGPFFEPRFFGDGLAIAVPKTDPELRRQLNGALRRVRESGRYEELIQRYLPNRIY